VATVIPDTALESRLLSSRYQPLPHVVWVRQGDATVLLDAERGVYYTLNEVAGRTWELLAAGEPLIEILRCLGDEFEVAAQTLETDTASLIEQLVEAPLIQRIAPGAGV
jgi:coenzyme PQQ synthesis protein D (PqqD)